MDKREKSALRSAYQLVANELILDEDFFASLKQKKIFTDTMLGIIKGETTDRKKVYKMLELLEKRGPQAFENFVAILKENYGWLAEKLEEEYQKRIQITVQHDQEHHLSHPIPPLHSIQYELQQADYSFTDNSPRPDTFRQTSVPHGASPRFHALCPPNLQIPISAHCIEDGQLRFFPYHLHPHHGFQTHLKTGVDNTDHHGKSLENIKSGKEQQTNKAEEGKYKDACNSPIGEIELHVPRKIASDATEQRIPDNDESSAEDEDEDQDFEEIRSQTSEESSVRLQLEENKYSESNYQLDAPEKINKGLNDKSPTKPDGTAQVNVTLDDADDDEFPSSEVFYERARRPSSCQSYFHDDMQKAVGEVRTSRIQSEMQVNTKEDENEDTMTRTESSFSQTSDYQEILDRMKTLYFKLATANAGSDDIEEDCENQITFDILEDEIDRLIGKLSDSDDNKLMQECITLFPEKERRQPLNICIENLLEMNKNMQEKLSTKSKEIDRMVYDMWNHQKDMKNIEKLKNIKDTLSQENKELKTTNQEINFRLNEQLRQVVQRDRRIEELEGKIRELKQKKSMLLGQKRGNILTSNKRPTMTMTQVPRRMPTEPRNPGIQASTSTNQTPPQRSVNTA